MVQVLKKADMIRKNAVESILAERNILISIRNPFVVCNVRNLYSPVTKNCYAFSNASISCAGPFFLFFHMPRKSLSGHGVLKWWRSLFIAEKSWLLRRRYGPHLHCRSCKAVLKTSNLLTLL